MKQTPSPVKRLWELTGTHRRAYMLSIILAILSVACGMIPYFAIAYIMLCLIDGVTALNTYALWCGVILLGFTLKLFFSTLSTTVSHTATFQTLKEVRIKIADKLSRVPMGYIIENNIKFGKPDATHEEVVRAAKSACCHDFIMALPNGYDTVIGESGATLSGGEKQRISIARAILKDTPIIILDEATSSVDPENEAELQQAIEKLTEDKTVIIIAHRLKTVRNAQQIVVIANGGIAQRGTHQELMEQPGIYADFVNVREKAINWKLSGDKPQR